ncbi:MAG TPA: hypothetical protein VFQ44_17875 [Streptosporangiaceae bacterium]|nr:hypothetical protein [Streptosporangiaceae bacterium]
MPGSHPISTYLAALHRHLPPGPADEVADGLLEAYQQHLARGDSEQAAAAAAIAETGDVGAVAAAYTLHAPGRRTARLLLITGPVTGGCWGTALISSHAWTWPVPAGARIALAATLLLAITGLTLAATAQRSYRRTQLTTPAGTSLIILDATMITAALLAAPALTLALTLASTVSLARIGFTIRSLPATAIRLPGRPFSTTRTRQALKPLSAFRFRHLARL